MTDTEGELLQPGDAERGGDLVLYDFFKHLTTLALLALGGILTIAEMSDRSDVKLPILIAVVVMVTLAGVISFAGTSAIAGARFAGKPVDRRLDLYRKWSPGLLSIGVGMFAAMFIDALN